MNEPEIILPETRLPPPEQADASWFYVKNKQKIGPVPLSDLRALASKGQLQPTDMLLQQGTSKWVVAASIPGLILPTSDVPTSNEPEEGTGPYQPTPSVAVPADQPQQIGRYQVEKVLGKGGFGTVYLGHDDDLHRPVAIKVPNRERVSSPQDAEAYLAEARVVASLDHPHIVPVYDVGRTNDSLCFVVSKSSKAATWRRK